MGNGIKMRTAVNAHGASYDIDALQAAHDANSTIPDLLCADPSCRKTVRFVPRHQQNRKDRIEPVDVPAYIGLTSGSEHADDCRYNVAQRFALIVDQSDRGFVSELEAGKRELRLLVLHNGLSGKPLSGNAPVPPRATAAAALGKGTKHYLSSGQKLDSYLRTTADLLELRALCDSDAALAAQLTLRFGPKRIAWNDFFFTRERYDEAWELLKKAGKNAHPMAFAAEVKSLYSPPSGAQYSSTFLNCRALYRRTGTSDRVESFEVSVMHADAAWLGGFPAGTHFVLFGLWEYKEIVENSAKDANDPRRTVTYVVHKLRLKPTFKQQVVTVV